MRKISEKKKKSNITEEKKNYSNNPHHSSNRNSCPFNLIAPAGSFQALEAALQAGASEIIAGLKGYSRRAREFEMTENEIIKAARLAEKHGAKLTVAVNAGLKPGRSEHLFRILTRLEKKGITSFIFCDPGLIALAKKKLSRSSIQASVYLSLQNTYDIFFYSELGATRFVLPLHSPGELSSIIKKTGARIAIFPAGYRNFTLIGNCYISSYVKRGINGKEKTGSFNMDGYCFRVCRFPWTLTSSSEITLQNVTLDSPMFGVMERLSEYIGAGVKDFKLPGREFSPALIRKMTSFVRQTLDDCWNFSENRPNHPSASNLKKRIDEWRKIENERFIETRKRTALMQHDCLAEMK